MQIHSVGSTLQRGQSFVTAVLEAEQRIRPFIRLTPLIHSHFLSVLGNSNVFIKLENLQHAGSCKARSALSKLLALSPEERVNGVVTASTGNNGIATAYALSKLGMTGTVYVPRNTSPFKLQEIGRHGSLAIQLHGDDIIEAEIAAREDARQTNRFFFSPYNEVEVIAGQGTIGMEIVQQLAEVHARVDSVIVPIGGGGLISGIAGYLKAFDPNVEVHGCLPVNSAVMYESIKAGTIVHLPSLPTLSDATAGGVEQDSITFELCREYVNDFFLVSEDEIAQAILLVLEEHRLLIEGASAMAIASFIKHRERFEGKTVVLTACGGNIGVQTMKALLQAPELNRAAPVEHSFIAAQRESLIGAEGSM